MRVSLILEKLEQFPYIFQMPQNVKFSGKVLRAEPDGFAIIQFDSPLGPSANTFGLVSSSTGTATELFSELKPGVSVFGTAEIGNRDLAAIKTLNLQKV